MCGKIQCNFGGLEMFARLKGPTENVGIQADNKAGGAELLRLNFYGETAAVNQTGRINFAGKISSVGSGKSDKGGMLMRTGAARRRNFKNATRNFLALNGALRRVPAVKIYRIKVVIGEINRRTRRIADFNFLAAGVHEAGRTRQNRGISKDSVA